MNRNAPFELLPVYFLMVGMSWMLPSTNKRMNPQTHMTTPLRCKLNMIISNKNVGRYRFSSKF